MRSDNVTKGVERAPNRSLFYALGYTPEELERPLIGVVSAYSEIVPGHMNLDKVADAVKAGIQMAGGTPILIPAIGVCDGIAMGHVGMKYSLASRELICDSVETMTMAHQLDGLVLVPNCDKIVPGMVMAAVRMDVPAVVCSGGPMLAGTYGGEEVSLSKMFEAVGAYKAPAAGKALRHGHYGDGQKGHHGPPDHQRALHPQRIDLRYGSGLLHQHRPPPAGHCL